MPSSAVKLLCDRVAISKADQHIDMSVFEDCMREVLDKVAPRSLAVLEPLKVTITNYPQDREEHLQTENHPKDPSMGTRAVPFSKDVFIEKSDFFDSGIDGDLRPPKGFKRLTLGGRVRLRLAYVITCDDVVRDSVTGEVTELMCSYDERTLGGVTPEGEQRCKGIVQWVSARHCQPAEVRLYDRLFSSPSPGKEHDDGDFRKDINANSLQVVKGAVVEPAVRSTSVPGSVFQFERTGYFCVDAKDNTLETLADGTSPMYINRVVTLRDSWARPNTKQDKPSSENKSQRKQTTTSDVEEVLRVEFRVGKVLSCEPHPDADSLLVEQIDCGDESGPRTVVSGLAKHISPMHMVGKSVVVIGNLKPSRMRGIQSEAMVLCSFVGEGDEEVVEVITAPLGARPGDVLCVEGKGPPQPDAVLKSKTAQAAFQRVVAKLSANDRGDVVWTDDDGVARRLVVQGKDVAPASPTLRSCRVG